MHGVVILWAGPCFWLCCCSWTHLDLDALLREKLPEGVTLTKPFKRRQHALLDILRKARQQQELPPPDPLSSEPAQPDPSEAAQQSGPGQPADGPLEEPAAPSTFLQFLTAALGPPDNQTGVAQPQNLGHAQCCTAATVDQMDCLQPAHHLSRALAGDMLLDCARATCGAQLQSGCRQGSPVRAGIGLRHDLTCPSLQQVGSQRQPGRKLPAQWCCPSQTSRGLRGCCPSS